MMEPLCRGQINSDEWIYGGVLMGQGGFSYIYGCPDGDMSGIAEKHLVYSDTLGLWTGAVDPDGKRVFSGDVLKGAHDCYSIVCYGPYVDRLEVSLNVGFYKIIVGSNPEQYVMAYKKGYPFGTPLSMSIEETPKIRAKVVGNIWNLPEFTKFRPTK